ncbi:DUF1090 domain-containing protein [Mitsuaria sp. 7]|uniref:DUF1090 domain-containing protein n=1 Tax=Mitsuaria sp. 7 TaxID=1658665 RepID=UPI0007DDA55C|nr:DUF1090 domain-containing protein [Mitsuaria sp. 7]ANH68867.1 hypothetical protein ABE85_17140 [Mitsuaria sp. 7]
MKALVASLLAIACSTMVSAAAPAADPPSPACAAKRASIESQIAEAQAKGNRRQLSGLQSALAANKRHCTDASLAAARQRDITAATKKVSRREADLAAAQAKGDAKKIAKEQKQLDAAREALSEAQKPVPQ